MRAVALEGGAVRDLPEVPHVAAEVAALRPRPIHCRGDALFRITTPTRPEQGLSEAELLAAFAMTGDGS